jgi:hypothetical protein
MSKVFEHRLIEEFKDRDAFSRNELYDFFIYFEPNLKEGTFGWRIYDLKKKNIIRSIKRGWYAISYKPEYKPELSSEIIRLSKLVTKHFQDLKYCVWETSWLNEFLQHQSSKEITIVEIEKGYEENLYFYLKDYFKHELYLNPDEKEIELYITESRKPIVIKKLITRSPISKQSLNKDKIAFPQLEKILVDLFSDEKLFYYYQGTEMTYLFENAINRYSINYTRLFSYAKRRDREEELKLFLNNNLKHIVINIVE